MVASRFNVFGRLIAVENVNGQWVPYLMGNEGKRRRAAFEIPEFVQEEELAQFLGDLFHESATPRNPEVVRLP